MQIVVGWEMISLADEALDGIHHYAGLFCWLSSHGENQVIQHQEDTKKHAWNLTFMILRSHYMFSTTEYW